MDILYCIIHIMNVVETIQKKVVQLPPQAQSEVLDLIEEIEERYYLENEKEHPLAKIARMSKDMGVTDLAEKHDLYAHGKLED